MNIAGLDFTSVPSQRKPITCALGTLDNLLLCIDDVHALTSFVQFEAFLRREGPQVAALDFPFGQPRKLLTNLGWPLFWEGAIQHISAMGKQAFETSLAQYQMSRLAGDKQHLRMADRAANARSPMMMYRVPVGKMFFQGAPRLLASDVSVLPCHPTTSSSIVLEGYPALVARKWIGAHSYKSDDARKQTAEQHMERQHIIDGIRSEALVYTYGLKLHLKDDIVDMISNDATGDHLDAVLCAIQAAWACIHRDQNYGIPGDSDALEGWIVDPALYTPL